MRNSPSAAATLRAPDQPAVERPAVIYVMGAGRSGSTILGVALGNCENVFYAGELEAWLRRSGEPNFAGDRRADFWRLVRNAVAGEDLYGEATWRYIDYSLAPLNPRGWLARRRMRDRYREITERLYRAVAATADSTHVVDSSHYPLRARELRRLSSIDAYVVYLVRRPQDVVASFGRRDITNSAKSVLAANAYLYLTHFLSIFAFMRYPRDRRMFIRYENLIADPEQTLNHVLTWSRCCSSAPDDLSSLDTGIAFQGNRLLESSTIDLRRQPRAAPSQRRRTLTAVLQYPWSLVHSRLRPVPPDAS